MEAEAKVRSCPSLEQVIQFCVKLPKEKLWLPISHTAVRDGEGPCPFLVPEADPLSVFGARDLFSTPGFLGPWDFYFVSAVFYVKPVVFPELNQKQQKRFCSKVGVFLARSGMKVGVQID